MIYRLAYPSVSHFSPTQVATLTTPAMLRPYNGTPEPPVVSHFKPHAESLGKVDSGALETDMSLRESPWALRSHWCA